MLGHVVSSLVAAELDQTHYITMGFLLGFEKGHRWRAVLTAMVSKESVQKTLLIEVRNALPSGPYQVGFDLGYAFECMRADDDDR